MPVSCCICHKEFPNLITSTHLKTHNMSTADYKNMYGDDSLASPEYRKKRSMAYKGENNPNYGNKMRVESRKQISEKTKGREPWNKGKKIEDTSAYKEAAIRREERYQSGELERKTHDYSIETRNKISQSIKEYAAEGI
jgi:chromatin segregation and condensation protein Rec8/ScpA/Scc1 (kleisin family)